MNNQEYLMLSSEINQLQMLIDEIPKYRVFEKKPLEARLKKLEKELSTVKEEALSQKAVITFRGEPVFGSYGILADFASKASGSFTDAVTAIATSLDDNLAYMGRIPNNKENQLIITNIARGSFGFEFEVPRNGVDTLIPEPTNVEKALGSLQGLLNSTLLDDEEKITDIVEEIHPRAVGKVVEFLDILKSNHAWFAYEFGERKVFFKNISDIDKAISILDKDNIKEGDETYAGEFQGILPGRRTFEFLTSDKKIIVGKIGSEIKDPDVLNREYLHQRITINLNTTQVGQSKPRYMLKDITNIKYIEKP